VSERNYRSASDDLAAARRLAPNDPIVLAAFGYFMLADGQFSRAVEAIQAAETAGLRDPVWLIPKARALLSLGRVDDAVRVHEQMLSLDPANPLVLEFTIQHFLMVQRSQAAERVVQLGAKVLEPLGVPLDAYMRFVVHGQLEPLSKAIGPHPPNSNAPASDLKNPGIVTTNFGMLRFEHRYADLAGFLERVPVPTLTLTGDENQIFDCVGARPTAEYRGWAYLLTANKAKARLQGDAVLAFVHGERETKWNRFFLRLLAAEAYTFTGQKEQAIAAAREGLGLMPRSVNAVAWVGAASLAARVYAWNGADEEAAKLLEELAGAAPGQQPAFIAMDPLLTLPLAHNARFQSLVARLDKQMRETPT
jgi:tetratricopeptide (TPR) repeat protein